MGAARNQPRWRNLDLLQIKLALEAMSDNKNSDSGLDFAWRVHDALDSWTGKVDVKASIALALESAVFGFVVALSEHGERFASLSGSRLNWYHIGVGLLLFSVATSLAIISRSSGAVSPSVSGAIM